MTYTVVWKLEARDRLAELWINHPTERKALTTASDQIDRLLRTDPQLRGEWVSGSTRVLIVLPLLVAYEVSEADRMVTVLAVRLKLTPVQGNGQATG